MVDGSDQILKREFMVDNVRVSLLYGATYHKSYSNFKMIVSASFVLRFQEILRLNVKVCGVCRGQVMSPLLLLFIVLENARLHLEVNFC